MNGERQYVEVIIREAFQGVVLGAGVGLLQGQAKDDYEDEKEPRSRDEKLDWSRIPTASLDQCYSSLPFFDAEGMRFHLPAYLIADLHDELLMADITINLTQPGCYAESQFLILNGEQRAAVREFLSYKLASFNEPERQFFGPGIDASLKSIWKAP